MILKKNNLAPSPLQIIEDERLKKHNIRLFLKRDDLLQLPFQTTFFDNPEVLLRSSSLESYLAMASGNKFRKLKYNLLEMVRQGLKKMLTFGGAFSNHIHAVAAVGQLLGIETIGIIRGERSEFLNPTLNFVEQCGMFLHFINRFDYQRKEETVHALKTQFGDFYYLPEGGTNDLALLGTAEIVPEIEQQLNGIPPDFISVAGGTGGTVAGIISAAHAQTQVLGFSVLKGDFLQKDVTSLLKMPKNTFYTEGGTSNVSKDIFSEKRINWSINTHFHCGGYARWTPELINFINDFKEKHSVPLDPIYTGKMLFGIFKLIELGCFPQNITIVAVHTGGLQGIEGFNQRFGQLIS